VGELILLLLQIPCFFTGGSDRPGARNTLTPEQQESTLSSSGGVRAALLVAPREQQLRATTTLVLSLFDFGFRFLSLPFSFLDRGSASKFKLAPKEAWRKQSTKLFSGGLVG
jgi:hypothetical protein